MNHSFLFIPDNPKTRGNPIGQDMASIFHRNFIFVWYLTQLHCRSIMIPHLISLLN